MGSDESVSLRYCRSLGPHARAAARTRTPGVARPTPRFSTNPNPASWDPVIDLERFWDGSQQYFEEMVRTYGPLVLTVTRAHSRDTNHAEDLFQEVWMRVFQKRRSYSGSGRFDAWIRKVANNVCIGDYRAHRAHAEAMRRLEQSDRCENPQRENGDPLADLERGELQIKLHRALTLVTEREHEAINLRIFEGRSPGEVAKIMGVEKSTVRSLLRKGINRLSKISGEL